MNHRPLDNSFKVLARTQPRPAHFVLINRKRHRGSDKTSSREFRSATPDAVA